MVNYSEQERVDTECFPQCIASNEIICTSSNVGQCRDSDETCMKCKIEMNSVNQGMFHHYGPIWPLAQNIPLEAMLCEKLSISSLTMNLKVPDMKIWQINLAKTCR